MCGGGAASLPTDLDLREDAAAAAALTAVVAAVGPDGGAGEAGGGAGEPAAAGEAVLGLNGRAVAERGEGEGAGMRAVLEKGCCLDERRMRRRTGAAAVAAGDTGSAKGSTSCGRNRSKLTSWGAHRHDHINGCLAAAGTAQVGEATTPPAAHRSTVLSNT